MHLEQLKKGDVVLNHKQVAQLMDTGKASGKGKVVGGMNAFAGGSGGYFGGYGAFNLNNLVWTEEEEDLDDYNDTNRNSAALNDNTDALKESTDTIDFVKIRLQYLSDKTKEIADTITEYVTTAFKKLQLEREISSLEDEIYANYRAANEYMARATQIAYEYAYFDEEGNKRHVRIANSGQFTLEELQTGAYRIQDMETTTPYQQALHDAAQEYMNYYNMAQDAARATRELGNTVRDVLSDLINIPVEDLQNGLSKVENTMRSITGYSNASAMGASTINALYDTIINTFRTNNDRIRADFSPVGTEYSVQNREAARQLTLELQKLNQTNEAYIASQANITRMQNLLLNAEAERELQKQLIDSRHVYMDSATRQAFNNGETIDATKFGDDMQVVVAAYNAAVLSAQNYASAVREAQDTSTDLFEQTRQEAAEYAQMQVQTLLDQMDNINNYYDTLAGWQGTLNDGLEASRSYLMNIGYYVNNAGKYEKTYSEEMSRLNLQLNYFQRSLTEQMAKLRQGIADGLIKVGSSEYINAMTTIEELKQTVISTRSEIIDLYSEMANIPNEIVKERLDQIAREYDKINSAEQSVQGGSRQALYNTITGQNAQRSSYVNRFEFGLGETFVAQNEYLNRQLEQQKQGMDAYLEALDKTGREVSHRQNELSLAEKQYENIVKNYLNDNNLRNLSNETQQKIRDAIANHTALSLSNDELKNSRLSSAVIDNFNRVVNAYNEAEGMLKHAQEAAYEAESGFNEAQNAYINALIDDAMQRLQNIANYYDKISQWQTTLAKGYANDRDFIKQIGNFVRDSSKYVSTYNGQVKELEEAAMTMDRASARMLTEFNAAMSSGLIKEGTEEWIDMLTSIRNVQDQARNTRSEIIKLYKELANVPNEVAKEKINDIKKAMSNLIANEATMNSMSRQAVYEQVSAFNEAQSSAVNANLYDGILDARYQMSDTYQSQNNYLNLQLESAKQQMEVYRDALDTISQEIPTLEADATKAENDWNRFLAQHGNITETIFVNGTDEIKDKINYALQNGVELVLTDAELQMTGSATFAKRWVELLNSRVQQLQYTRGKLTAQRDALDVATENFNQAQADYVNMVVDNAEKRMSNIDAYFKSIYEYNQKIASQYGKIRDVMDELGRDMDRYGDLRTDTNALADNYMTQIRELTNARLEMQRSINEQEAELARLVQNGAIRRDSEEFRNMKGSILSLNESAMDLTINIDQLYDKMIEEVRFRPIEEALDKLSRLQTSILNVNGLIEEEMKLTRDGQYSQLGMVSVAADMRTYKNTVDAINEQLRYIKEINELYNDGNNDVQFSAEEYKKYINERITALQEEVRASAQARQAIITDITNRYRREIDYVKELIDARKEALQKQKEMVAYEKSIRNQTDEVKRIEAQIRALEGLTDAESKAQKARLEAQRQQAQDSLDEAIQEHIYNLRIEGMEGIQQKLDENFESLSNDLALNVRSVVETINDFSQELIPTLNESNSVLDNYLKTFNSNLSLASMGLTTFSAENTTKLEGIEESLAHAQAMEYYTENYSKEEYDYWQSVKNGVQQLEANVSQVSGEVNGTNATIRDNSSSIVDSVNQNATSTNTVFREELESGVKQIVEGLGSVNGAVAGELDTFGQNMITQGINTSQQIADTGDMVVESIKEVAEVIRNTTPEKPVTETPITSTPDSTPNNNQFASLFGDGAISTKYGILKPLDSSSLIQSQVISGISQLVQSKIPEISAFTSSPDLTNIKQSNNNVHYDSLITINGNVDREVMPRIEEVADKLLKNSKFMYGTYTYNQNTAKKEARKM